MVKLFIISIFFTSGMLAFGQDVNKVDSLEVALASAKTDTGKVNTLISLAKIAIIQKDSAQASNYCIQAKILADSLNYTKGVADAIFHIGSVYMENSAYKEAIESYSQSIKVHQKIDDDYMIMRGLLNIGVAYYFLGNVDEAIVYMDSSLVISKKLKDYYHIVRTTINLGGMYSIKLDYVNALRTYDNALEITKEQNDTSNLVALYSNIGEVYTSLANYPVALNQFQKALSIIDVNKSTFDLLLLYYYIGDVHLKLNNNEKKMEYFHKALKVSKEINNKYYITVIEIALGKEYKKEGDFEQALKFFNNALEKAQQMESESQIAHIYLSISYLYLEQEEFEKSLEMANKSLDINNNLKSEYGKAECYKAIGEIYFKMNNLDSALHYFDLSRNIYEETNSTNELHLLYKGLSDVYSSVKNYKEAYIYHVKYNELKDSIYSDENIKEITSMQMKFDYDKEKEIAQLEQQRREELYQVKLDKQKIVQNSLYGGIGFLIVVVFFIFRLYQLKHKSNRILKDKNELIKGKNKEIEIHRINILEQNMKLKELVKTRDKYISVLAHDLKSVIGGSTSLIELLEDNGKDWDSRDMILDQLFKNSRNAYELLNHVVEWGKASLRKESVTPEKLQLFNAIENIKNLYKLQLGQKDIVFENNCAQDQAIVADSNMLDAVFRNLIQNAIKYSKNNGIITVDVKSNDEETEICVSDTGVGMSKEKATNLFTMDGTISEPGTAGEKGTGLGLQIIKEYIAIHGGKIWVESKQESLDAGKAGGTKVFFTLKNKSDT